jgi:nitrogenase molybdenum-iron protein alpha chain
MALNLDSPESMTREKRLGSITGYTGTFQDLTKQGCGGCLKNRRRCFTTPSTCSHVHSINQLASIEDAVIVDHAPIGCSGSIIYYTVGMNTRPSDRPDGKKRLAAVISSNMTENDTVFGGVDKLRETILEAYARYKPKAIYVVNSCTSSIIGDDVFSVAQATSEELGIPVGFAAGEGIRSKIWSSGFDAYAHAVSRTLLEAPLEKANTVNYIAFTKINRENLDHFINRLGFEVLYLTGSATIEEYQRASRSIATFGQCGSQSSYLAGALEQMFGVKYFQTHLPFGGIGFERFYRDLASYVGKADTAEQVIQEERALYADELEELRRKLKGKTAFVALGASYAFEYVRMLNELGVKTTHAVAYHYDPRLDGLSDEPVAAVADADEFGYDFTVTVNDAQEQETYLLMRKYPADIFISRSHGGGLWAARTGMPTFEAEIGLDIIGYKGLAAFGKNLVSRLANTNFTDNLGRWYRSPFTEAFENRDPCSFFEEDEG